MSTITDPLAYSLLPDDVRARDERPLIDGDFSSFRVQVLNADGTLPEDLTGSTFSIVLTDCQGNETIRDSETELTGHAGTNEIEIDDQTSGSITSDTGRGWLEVFFSDTEDFSAFVDDAGTYKLRRNPPTNKPYTILRGEVAFL